MLIGTLRQPTVCKAYTCTHTRTRRHKLSFTTRLISCVPCAPSAAHGHPYTRSPLQVCTPHPSAVGLRSSLGPPPPKALRVRGYLPTLAAGLAGLTAVGAEWRRLPFATPLAAPDVPLPDVPSADVPLGSAPVCWLASSVAVWKRRTAAATLVEARRMERAVASRSSVVSTCWREVWREEGVERRVWRGGCGEERGGEGVCM
jgi:hypothetical protein